MIQNMFISFLLDFHPNEKHNIEMPSQSSSPEDRAMIPCQIGTAHS